VTKQDVIFAAADFTCDQVNHDNFTKLAASSIKVCISEMLPFVETSDQPGLFSPLEVHVDGAWEQGCILSVRDRAVVAWFKGTLRRADLCSQRGPR
jgi:hypothetical protein